MDSRSNEEVKISPRDPQPDEAAKIDNLTPACARCNWGKQARTPEQWRGEA